MTKLAPMVPMIPVNNAPHSRPNRIVALAPFRTKRQNQNIDADVNAGPHAIGCAELRHPHEHVDAKLLRPGQMNLGEERIGSERTGPVAMIDDEIVV